MLSAFWLLSTLPIILLVTLLSPTTSPHTFLPPYNPLIIPPNDPARILLLTSHPDDECLFFAPTLLALLRQGACPQGVNASEFRKNEVHSLCLSTGNAHGLGAVRAEELERSLDILGVDKDKRRVLNTTCVSRSCRRFTQPHLLPAICRTVWHSTGTRRPSQKP
jgi:N-acetylglucosaminylphosphatidylinositol deacetylase